MVSTSPDEHPTYLQRTDTVTSLHGLAVLLMAHVGAFAGGVDEEGVPMNITFRQLVLRRSSIRLSSTCIYTQSDTSVHTMHIWYYHVHSIRLTSIDLQ